VGRPIGAGGTAALTPYAAIVASSKPGRIVAVTPASGTVRADVRTDGKVFAVGPPA
jgi:outer membrane protein assembly factor BamB